MGSLSECSDCSAKSYADRKTGVVSTKRSNNDYSDCFMDLLQVVEWIEKGNSENILRADDISPCPVAIMLENKYKFCTRKISELERKLDEAQGENGVLRTKLDAMELLAGHHHSELIRVGRELELQKWERFDMENKLEKMEANVASMNTAVEEILANMMEKDDENICSKLVISDTRDSLITQQNSKDLEFFFSMLKEVTGRVNDRLQVCKDIQSKTKMEVEKVFKTLENLEMKISEHKVLKEKQVLSKIEVIPSEKVILPKQLFTKSSPVEAETIKPVPIKSIVMRRSADGTFEITRNGKYDLQREQVASRKRKTANDACFQPPQTVYEEKHDVHRENPGELLSPLLADPLELDEQEEELNDTSKHSRIGGIGKEIVLRYECTSGKSFSKQKILDDPLSEKGNGKIFYCPQCPQMFVFQEVLNEHMRRSHKIFCPNGNYRCRECGNMFSEYRQLRQHMRSRHQKLK